MDPHLSSQHYSGHHTYECANSSLVAASQNQADKMNSSKPVVGPTFFERLFDSWALFASPPTTHPGEPDSKLAVISQLQVSPNGQSIFGQQVGASEIEIPHSSPQSADLDANYQLEALSERWQIYLAILYSLTAVTSFILNVITVIVLSRCRRSELRKYLINLSMSDLLMSLFSIPFTYTEYMLGRWIFAHFLCPVVRFVVTLSVVVSVATMIVIGINRYLAIMYPFRKRKCYKFRQCALSKNHVIIAIWLVGIAISMPEYLMYHVEPFCHNKQYYFACKLRWSETTSDRYTIFIYLSTFVIPLALLSYLYTRMGLKLWRRQMPGNVDVNRDLTMQTMRIKVIKMLFVVVILFAVSWLPLQTFSMITFLFPETRSGFVYQSLAYNIFIGSYFACHWLSMAHSCLNPLIYCFMNDKFRSDLQDLLCKRKNRQSDLGSSKLQLAASQAHLVALVASNQVSLTARGANLQYNKQEVADVTSDCCAHTNTEQADRRLEETLVVDIAHDGFQRQYLARTLPDRAEQGRGSAAIQEKSEFEANLEGVAEALSEACELEDEDDLVYSEVTRESHSLVTDVANV